MERLVQLMDDLDDLTGLLFEAATPGTIVAIVAGISVFVTAIVMAGLRGLLIAFLLSGVPAALALLKPVRRAD